MKTVSLLLLSLFLLSVGSAEPQAPPVAKPDQEKVADPSAIVVFITNTGKRYHRESCRYAKIKSNLKEAKARGLTPCQVCNP